MYIFIKNFKRFLLVSRDLIILNLLLGTYSLAKKLFYIRNSLYSMTGRNVLEGTPNHLSPCHGVTRVNRFRGPVPLRHGSRSTKDYSTTYGALDLEPWQPPYSAPSYSLLLPLCSFPAPSKAALLPFPSRNGNPKS